MKSNFLYIAFTILSFSACSNNKKMNQIQSNQDIKKIEQQDSEVSKKEIKEGCRKFSRSAAGYYVCQFNSVPPRIAAGCFDAPTTISEMACFKNKPEPATADACRKVFRSPEGEVACYANKPRPETVFACGKYQDVASVRACISFNPPANKVEECRNLNLSVLDTTICLKNASIEEASKLANSFPQGE